MNRSRVDHLIALAAVRVPWLSEFGAILENLSKAFLDVRDVAPIGMISSTASSQPTAVYPLIVESQVFWAFSSKVGFRDHLAR